MVNNSTNVIKMNNHLEKRLEVYYVWKLKKMPIVSIFQIEFQTHFTSFFYLFWQVLYH
jgi:hypothetical protein